MQILRLRLRLRSGWQVGWFGMGCGFFVTSGKGFGELSFRHWRSIHRLSIYWLCLSLIWCLERWTCWYWRLLRARLCMVMGLRFRSNDCRRMCWQWRRGRSIRRCSGCWCRVGWRRSGRWRRRIGGLGFIRWRLLDGSSWAWSWRGLKRWLRRLDGFCRMFEGRD